MLLIARFARALRCADTFARSLTHSLAPHCLLRSRAPLRSFIFVYGEYGLSASISYHFSPQCIADRHFKLDADDFERASRLIASFGLLRHGRIDPPCRVGPTDGPTDRRVDLVHPFDFLWIGDDASLFVRRLVKVHVCFVIPFSENKFIMVNTINF